MYVITAEKKDQAFWCNGLFLKSEFKMKKWPRAKDILSLQSGIF